MIPVDVYWVSAPKSDRSADENEDRVARYNLRNDRYDTTLVGIADGVSDSVYSGPWAEALLDDREWTRLLQPERYSVSETLERWRHGAIARLGVPSDSALPWYLKAKARRGSAATFLGVRLRRERREGAKIQIDVVSIGDCGMFLFQDDHVAVQFPVLRPEEYGNSPESVVSIRATPEASLLRTNCSHRLRKGTALILATDAMAQWMASDSNEIQDERVRRVLACADEETFATLVRTERGRGHLRDDDSTVLVVSRRG